jgi:hypothetical protein
MAYKFQRGSAILSGALLQEGDVEIESGFNFKMHDETVLDTSRNLTVAGMSGSGALQVGGTATIAGAADLNGTLDVAGDTKLAASGVGTQIRGDLAVDEAATFNSSLTVASGSLFSGSGDFHLAGAADLNGTLDVAGDTKLAASGVGTQIRGDLTVDEAAVFSSTVQLDGALDVNAAADIQGALNLQAGITVAGAADFNSTSDFQGAMNLQAGITVAGDVQLDGAGDTDLNVGADSFYFFDADNSLVKRDTMADYATAVAGDGLVASAGVLAVQVDDSGIEIDSDTLRLKDSGVVTDKIADDAVTLAKMAGITRGSIISGDASGDPQYLALGSNAQMLISSGSDLTYVSLSGDVTIDTDGVIAIGATKVTDAMLNDDVATGLAGDGLGASSGVLAVQVSGAIAIHSDYVGLSGSVAGNGLGFKGGADSISALEVDLSEFDAGVIASGDSFAFIDADDNDSMKQETVDDLADLFAGAGLTATSGVLAVVNATNGGLFVDSDAISLSLDDLAAADVDVANDSIAYYDDSESGTRKESIADLVAAMAGAGLTATNGVLSADSAATPALKADGDELQEGYNYFDEELSNNLSASLPAAATPGDVVHVKAGNLGEDVTLKIMPYAAQTIDGESEILLESPYAAVSLVYVVSGSWRIV